MRPHPYQVDGAAWLATRRAALLADEPGAGKTVQVLLAIAALGEWVDVVVPSTAVLAAWADEITRWASVTGDLPGVRILMPYRAPLDRGPADVVVVDEPGALVRRAPWLAGWLGGAKGRTWFVGGRPEDAEAARTLLGRPLGPAEVLRRHDPCQALRGATIKDEPS